MLLSANNLILHTVFALSLSLLLSFLKIPALFLYGLHTYIHPDDVNPNNNTSSKGIRAAIRRPGALDSEQPRKKSKERFEFDENKAQIFRLKLNESQLQSRIYFREYYSSFNFTIIAILSLLLHKFLQVDSDSDTGIVKNGTIIPILLGIVGVCRDLFLIVRLSLERSASKRLDRQLSFILGLLGFLLGLIIVVFDVVPKWVLDFRFQSLDGFGKFTVAVFMGCFVGFLYIPTLRNARAFWLGTDQIRCNLSIISCGWIPRMLLYATYLSVVFTSLLYISPFAEFFVNKTIDVKEGSFLASKSGAATELAGNVGMSRTTFEKFRLWCLFITGLLQILTVRPNAQMFLNEAVLCWYQRLHASKVPDLEYSRAKVFIHNHYISLVVLQLFLPASMVLVLLGLSQIDNDLLTDIRRVCNSLPCSGMVREMTVFMAWWIIFVWAVFTSVILALYRRGILYVS